MRPSWLKTCLDLFQRSFQQPTVVWGKGPMMPVSITSIERRQNMSDHRLEVTTVDDVAIVKINECSRGSQHGTDLHPVFPAQQLTPAACGQPHMVEQTASFVIFRPRYRGDEW